jgi:multiple sugar transport system substrate-binding protein
MTPEIEFSIMASSAEGLRPLLAQFEAETGAHVNVRLLAWDTAWSTFVRAALYSDGPDLSEIGTTWVGDLVGMNALRPFNAGDVALIGKRESFFAPAWKSATQSGDSRVWAIPWLSGARLVYYRAGLLEQAGLDPLLCFASNAALEDAIRRLAECGVPIPWTVPTGQTHTTLLNAASWVWASGGDFLSDDGRATRFMEPAALDGLQAYFRLGRYLAGDVRTLNGLEPDAWFLKDPQTAMTVSGPWLFCSAPERMRSERIAVALPPGPSFVGGSNLIVWKHCRNPETAVKLIRFLTRIPAQASYGQFIGLLPARLAGLQTEPFSSDPYWQTAVRGLMSGRTFPTIRLWGLVEDRLAAAFRSVWSDLLADPSADPRAALVQHLSPLARRLDPLLAKG